MCQTGGRCRRRPPPCAAASGGTPCPSVARRRAGGHRPVRRAAGGPPTSRRRPRRRHSPPVLPDATKDGAPGRLPIADGVGGGGQARPTRDGAASTVAAATAAAATSTATVWAEQEDGAGVRHAVTACSQLRRASCVAGEEGSDGRGRGRCGHGVTRRTGLLDLRASTKLCDEAGPLSQRLKV